MLLPTRQLRFLLRIPVTRVLLITSLGWLFAFTFCKFTYWRDPHSAFFKSDHVYDLQYSAQRRLEARRFIHEISSDDGVMVKANGNGTIMCAAFVTVKRDGRQYLDEAIGTMLTGLSPAERESIYLSVLFADTVPEIHPHKNAPWIQATTDHRFSYASSSQGIPESELLRIKEAEQKRNFYVKGVFDYLMVLQECMDRTEAPFIAVFEDDIVFAEGWYSRTLRGLGNLQMKGRRWVYLRLFFTETSLSWQTGDDFWYRNMPFAFFLASSIGLGALLHLRDRYAPVKEHLDNFSIAAVVLVTIPAFLALVFMVGKYSLKPLKGVVPMNKYGCCTQAMIFPRSEVPALMGYLRERVHGQTDSMIEEYSDRDGLDRFALAPQVVQHVGLVSSRDNTLVNTQSNWAFWFETNKPEKLQREHMNDLKIIPWNVLRGF